MKRCRWEREGEVVTVVGGGGRAGSWGLIFVPLKLGGVEGIDICSTEAVCVCIVVLV